MSPDINNVAYIGLGSNIDPEINLARAVRELSKRTNVVALSSTWQSPAAGTTGDAFLNAAAQIETDRSAKHLKTHVLRPIESDLGRRRGVDRNAPRTIDLDILIFDGQEIDPEIWNQPHIAIPLSEIYPKHVNPATGETLAKFANSSRTQVRLHHLTFRD